MVPRRTLLRWLAVGPLAALLAPRIARATPPPGGVFDGESAAQTGPGVEPLLMTGGFVRLGRKLLATPAAVFSRSNTNDRYVAVVHLPAVPEHMVFLSLPGGVLRSDSTGSGFGGAAKGSASFSLDRALADEVARAWGMPRKDRVPLGLGVAGHFRPKAPLMVGSPMPMVVAITNPAAGAIGVAVGGRQRGPRDNRFSFVVEQNGKALPAFDVPDFGGPMGYREIKAGAPVEVETNLASWASITAPGAYRVRCSYQTDLVPGTQFPSWPDHGHETWDLTLSETIDVMVIAP